MGRCLFIYTYSNYEHASRHCNGGARSHQKVDPMATPKSTKRGATGMAMALAPAPGGLSSYRYQVVTWILYLPLLAGQTASEAKMLWSLSYRNQGRWQYSKDPYRMETAE